MDQWKNDTTIFLVRTICSFISVLSCSVIMGLYFFLCCLVGRKKNYNKKIRNSLDNNESSELEISRNHMSDDKIGLGSHFMFSLVFSYFCESISYIVLYFISNGQAMERNLFIPKCKFFGFMHYFFDLLAVFFTSSITYLFLKSTKQANFTSRDEERKTLLICLIPSMIGPLFLSLTPVFIKETYGAVGAYCTFISKYEEKIIVFTFTWSLFIVCIITVNLFFNLYCFYKVFTFYNNKLENLDVQSKERRVIRKFVFVFLMFPIMLLLTRGIKGLNRVMDNFGNLNSLTFSLISSSFNCLNGLFNSILCFYFFRGVYKKCPCFKKKINVEKSDTLYHENGDTTYSIKDVEVLGLEED